MSIVHWDADAFFASVEQAADRRLRNRPVAVGGGERGVVCSVSYEARAYGVRTAMPTRRALELCPDLVLVKGKFDLYEQFSDNLFERCRNLTPYVEQASIDEGYMDFSGWGGTNEGLIDMLSATGREIRADLKITVSQGVASNKRVSAIASKLQKPRGFIVVPPGAEQAFLEPLPIGRLPGVGPVLRSRLEPMGIHKIGDLLKVGPAVLYPLLGSQTPALLAAARGEDNRRVEPKRTEQESIGKQETFECDCGDEQGVEIELKRMLEVLLTRLRGEQRQARTLTVRLRYTDFEEQSASHSLSQPSDLAEDFHPYVRLLLKKAWARRVHIRLVGLQLSNLYQAVRQTELFDDGRDRKRILAATIDKLREQFGAGTLQRAGLMAD